MTGACPLCLPGTCMGAVGRPREVCGCPGSCPGLSLKEELPRALAAPGWARK